MRTPSENLEHLISRYLDDEAGPEDRRALDAALREDLKAQALFDESVSLERELRAALRAAGRRAGCVYPTVARRRRLGWGGLAALGMAASLAAAFWIFPIARQTQNGGQGGTHAGQNTSWGGQNGSSWFAPPPAPGDSFVAEPPAAAAPHIRIEDTEREWIVVPGRRAGEFLIVEVKHIRAQRVRIERDF